MNGISDFISIFLFSISFSLFSFFKKEMKREEKEKKENLRKGSGKMQLEFVLCEVMLV